MSAAIDGEGARKRKAHNKSRKGCGNCKMRRVKCDETQPACNKCKSYGISCNFGEPASELVHQGEGAFVVESFVSQKDKTVTYRPQEPITPTNDDFAHWLNHPMVLHDTDEVYRISETDLDRFRRFQDRTVFTIGTAQTVYIYRDSMVQLAFHHSYLIHIIFAMVLMHDRHLSDKPWGPPSHAETFHHYHGTAIFNKLLSNPIKHEEKDAMWGAAALLGAITLASLDATTPDECWPLSPESDKDLDWLRMSDGKKEVWNLADPTRKDSIWRPSLTYPYEHETLPRTHRTPEIDCVSPFLLRLYNYPDPDSCQQENPDDPYHTAASILIRLLPIECTHTTILYFLSFISHLQPCYRALLHAKDAKALLLLAWWYAKMLDYPAWWLQRRAKLECKAICVYLQGRWMWQSEVGRALEWPKMMCGLAVSPVFSRRVDEARMEAGRQCGGGAGGGVEVPPPFAVGMVHGTQKV